MLRVSRPGTFDLEPTTDFTTHLSTDRKDGKLKRTSPLRCLTDYKHRKPTSNPLTRSLTSPITFGTYLSPCPLRLRRPSRDRFFPMQKKPFPTQGRGWITVIRSRSTDSRERLCFPGKFSSLDKWRREWKKTREERAKGTVKWPGSGGKTKSAFEIFEKGRRGSSLGYTTEERETVGKWKLEEEGRG